MSKPADELLRPASQPASPALLIASVLIAAVASGCRAFAPGTRDDEHDQ